MSGNTLARLNMLDASPVARQLDEVAVDTLSPARSSSSGLARRMQVLIRNEGSMASIARRCGFSEGAVRSWRDGHSDISRERCVVMARTLGVSLTWLVTGEGPMRESPVAEAPMNNSGEAVPALDGAKCTGIGDVGKSRVPTVNSRLLAAALRLLQSYVGLLGGSLNPTQRADALAELYDILGTSNDPDHIDHLIAFHATLRDRIRRGGSLVA